MAVEDVQVPGLTGEPEPQGEGQPQPAVAPEETIPYKWRDEEKQLPASHVDAIAERLGVSREGFVNALQIGRDQSYYQQESRRRERELARREAEADARDAYFQQLEAQRSQGTPPAAPQFAAPQQAGMPNTDDPMALLRWQSQLLAAQQQRFDSFERTLAEQRQIEQERFKAAFEDQQVQLANEAYSQTSSWWQSKYPGLPAPSHEDIVDEMIASGMAENRRLSYAEGYRRAARNLMADEIDDYLRRKTLQNARDPKATLTLPAGGSAQAPPQAKPKSDIDVALDNMTMGEIASLVPDKR